MSIQKKSRLQFWFFNSLPLLLFSVVGLIAMLNHAMWRDEMQAWLIAKDSETWHIFLENMAPEGHPMLWHILLIFIHKVANNPISMQLFHWSLASLSLFIFWSKSPFSYLHKLLFTFGYFPFYEYFVFSRNYVLVELFGFLCCSFYTLRRKSYLPLALCIGLLANCHAFSFLIAISLILALVIEWFTDKTQRNFYQARKIWQWDLILSCFCIIALITVSALSILQASDSTYLATNADPPTLLKFDIRHMLRVMGRILGGYTLLIPDSSKWLDLWVCSAISLGLVTATVNFLRNTKTALIFYLSSTITLAAFNYFVYLGGEKRHYGFYLLILVFALWLSLIEQKETRNKTRIAEGKSILDFIKIKPLWYRNLFTVFLVIHLIFGLSYFLLNFSHPLSASKATAEYIQDQNLQDNFIVASRDVNAAAISGYLDTEFYYPELQRKGSFAEWNNRVEVSQEETFKQVEQLLLSLNQQQKILLLLNYELEDLEWNEIKQSFNVSLEDSSLELMPIQKFEDANQAERARKERFYLYWAQIAIAD